MRIHAKADQDPDPGFGLEMRKLGKPRQVAVFVSAVIAMAFTNVPDACADPCASLQPSASMPAGETVTRKHYDGLLRQWTDGGYRFTPEVRTGFLAFRKAQALEQLASHGVTMPDAFMAWIDSSPVASSTIYGIRHGSPAQALILLRSLEFDLGKEDMRAHLPVVLATVMLHAAEVDPANPEALPHVSLEPREPMAVKIPESTMDKVNTRPTDRPLDINDHIINFMEEEEVVENGKVVSTKLRDEPIRACDIVASNALQKAFNTYMQGKVEGFKPLVCGESLNWRYGGVSWRLPERGELGRAWNLFYEAYTTKGRLPEYRDPTASPVEWLVYQINNAKTRDVELPDVWPYAMYLMSNRQPLRESEYVWNEEVAKGLSAMRYVDYAGKIAQDPSMLKLRRMTAFDYAYGSLPMQRKDGGVCGTHTSTGLKAGAALGLCILNCSSPGHSYPGRLSGTADGTYSATFANTGVQWYFGEDKPEGTGKSNKLISLAAAMNWGIQGFLDSQLGWTMYLQLSDDDRAAHGQTLLKSSLMLNPYNYSLAQATLATTETAQDLIGFWEAYRSAIDSAKDKNGCVQDGPIIDEVWLKISAGFEKQTVPSDPALRDRIHAAISKNGCSPKLLAIYELELNGIDAVLNSLAKDLSTYFSSYYRPQAECQKMVAKLRVVLDMVEDPDRRSVWLKAQMTTLADRGLCLTKHGKHYQVQQDETALLLAELTETPVDEEAWMKALLDVTTLGLDVHINGRRSTPSCKDMASRLKTITAAAREAGIDQTSWAHAWFEMMDGKQRYGRPSWCAKDAASVVIDALVVEYPLKGLAALKSKYGALEQELNELNKNTAGGSNQDRINAINEQMDQLSKQIAEEEK
jgi:hypothetical protein